MDLVSMDFPNAESKSGRVRIPRGIVETLGLKHGQQMMVSVRRGEIVFSPYVYGECVFCGQPTQHSHAGKPLCDACLKEIARAVVIVQGLKPGSEGA